MDITLDKKDTTSASIKIKLTQEDYQPKVEAKLKEYSKKAVIKGFRPGKVPATLIKKMYGRDILIDEVLHLVSHSLEDYIKASNLNILGQPLPETGEDKNIDWSNPSDLEFTYSVGFVPDFQVNPEVEITTYPIAVSDELVEQTIERLRKQYGKYQEVEKSEKGDFVKGELTKPGDDSFQMQEVFIPLNQVKEELVDKFLGRAKEDVIKFDIENLLIEGKEGLKKVINLPKETIDTLSGEFELKVTYMDRHTPAELNQDFFDKLFKPGEVASEQALKDKIKETLSENYQKETDYLLYKHLQSKLIEDTTIDLPKDFLKKWIASNQKETELTAEEIEKDFDNFLKQVKWDVIEDKLAKEFKIEVAREEVIEKARQHFEHTLLNMGFAREMMHELDNLVMNHLAENKGQNYMKYHGEVIFEKLMHTLKDKVTANPKEVTYEEFKKIVEDLKNT